MQIVLKRVGVTDEPLLREYLYLALYVADGEHAPRVDIVESPTLVRYVDGWGRSGDYGLLAIDEQTGRDVGAAWLRLWSRGDEGYGFVDYETAELSMAVRPALRGRGIGTDLLRRLLGDADERYAAVSLSVSDDNPAMRLYARLGFRPVVSHRGSTTMLRKC